MEAIRFIQKVTDDTLVIPLPVSFREQEVEVIVLKTNTASKPELTAEEKLAVLRKFKGIFSNSTWQPGLDFEDELYTQE